MYRFIRQFLFASTERHGHVLVITRSLKYYTMVYRAIHAKMEYKITFCFDYSTDTANNALARRTHLVFIAKESLQAWISRSLRVSSITLVHTRPLIHVGYLYTYEIIFRIQLLFNCLILIHSGCVFREMLLAGKLTIAALFVTSKSKQLPIILLAKKRKKRRDNSDSDSQDAPFANIISKKMNDHKNHMHSLSATGQSLHRNVCWPPQK